MSDIRFIDSTTLQRQAAAILSAWGMPAPLVETTTKVMIDADLSGVDSHGISMMMMCEAMQRGGGLRYTASASRRRRGSTSSIFGFSINVVYLRPDSRR